MADRKGSGLIQIGYKPDLLNSGLSVWLDHFRWIAALAVVCDHARMLLFPSALPGHLNLFQQVFFFLSRFGKQAVVVFFVISGLLVGGSIIRRLRAGTFVARNYALDRVSRLGVVLVPAIIWSVGFQHLGYTLDCQKPDGWATILGNLLSLQNLGVVRPICNDDPLWSLSSEAWFYVVAPALMLIVAGVRRPGTILTLVGALALGMMGWTWDEYSPFFGLILWMAGLIPWFVTIRTRPVYAGVFFVAMLVLSRTSIFVPEAMRPPRDLLLMVAFVLLLCVDAARWNRPLARFGHAFAGFSYSLYLAHMPIAQAWGWAVGRGALPVDKAASYLVYAACVGVIVLVGWGFGALFESRTGAVRDWLYRKTG